MASRETHDTMFLHWGTAEMELALHGNLSFQFYVTASFVLTPANATPTDFIGGLYPLVARFLFQNRQSFLPNRRHT